MATYQRIGDSNQLPHLLIPTKLENGDSSGHVARRDTREHENRWYRQPLESAGCGYFQESNQLPHFPTKLGNWLLSLINHALIVVLAVVLAGCALQGKKPAAPATPSAPAAVAKPAPPPPPLSIPQTQVEIPTPQPVTAEALAAGQAPPEEPEPAAPPRPVRRVTPPPPAPRPEPPAAEEPARAPIQEVLSSAERKHLQDSTAERKREIRRLVDQARHRRLNAHESSVVARIDGLVKLSGDAEAKGDLREADALAQRALVLAKDLDSGR
jgi:hypothetical protein